MEIFAHLTKLYDDGINIPLSTLLMDIDVSLSINDDIVNALQKYDKLMLRGTIGDTIKSHIVTSMSVQIINHEQKDNAIVTGYARGYKLLHNGIVAGSVDDITRPYKNIDKAVKNGG